MTALVVALSLTTAPLARPATALSSEDKARAEAKALQAKFKFKAGHYGEAGQLFLQAFAISRAPALIYNAARAFEEAGSLKEAKAAFEQYLELQGVSAAGRKDAKAKIASLEARIAKGEKSAEAKQAAEAKAADARRSEALAKERARAADAEAAAKRAREQAEKARLEASAVRKQAAASSSSAALSWGLVGGGGAVSLVGLLVMASGASAQDDANLNTDWSAPDARETYNAASDSARQGWGAGLVVTLVGAGALAWGLARVLKKPSKARTALTTHPAVLRGARGAPMAGWALGGRF